MSRCRSPVNRLLMMRKPGLRSPLMQNIGNGLCAKSAGRFVGQGITAVLSFLSASIDQAIMSLQNLGKGTPTASTGGTSHWVPDYEGIYQEFVDEPVWTGGRVTGSPGSRVVYSTETDGTPISKQLVSNSGTGSVLDGAIEYAFDKTGAPYLRGNGVDGQGVAAPDSAALSITSNIDIRAKVKLDGYTENYLSIFVSKMIAIGNYSYDFYHQGVGVYVFRTSENGSVVAVSSTTAMGAALTDGEIYWLRATHDFDTNTTSFYYSTDNENWTQVATTTQDDHGSGIYDGNTAIMLGANDSVSPPTNYLNSIKGNYYQAQIYDGIDGTLVFDWNASQNVDNNPTAPDDLGNVFTYTDISVGYDEAGSWTPGDAASIIMVVNDKLRIYNSDATTSTATQTLTTIPNRKVRAQWSASGTNPRFIFQDTDNIGVGIFQEESVVDSTTEVVSLSTNTVLQGAYSEWEYIKISQDAPGLSYAPGSTDSALHNRDLTNAAWVKTSVTAAKDAEGADGTPSGASTLTATGANGTVLQTVTAASGTHAFRPLVKRKTGTGTIEITTDNGGTWTDITSQLNSLKYTRVVTDKAAVTNPQFGFRIVTSGDEVEVDFAGLYLNTTAAEVELAPVIETGATGDAISRSVYNWDSTNHDNNGGLWTGTLQIGYPNMTHATHQGVWSASVSSGRNLFYDNIFDGRFISNDGIDKARIEITYNANDMMPWAVPFGNTRMRAGIKGEYGNEDTYDGTYPQDTALEAFVNSDYPGVLRDITFWLPSDPLSDDFFDAMVEKGLETMIIE